jgi:hypothetical protein
MAPPHRGRRRKTHNLWLVVAPNAGIKANKFTEILVLHTMACMRRRSILRGG